MYFYYMCAAFGPGVQKYLWWKKYITTIQLVQFVLVFFHAIQPIFFTCEFPKAASLMFAGISTQYSSQTSRQRFIFLGIFAVGLKQLKTLKITRNWPPVLHLVHDVLQEDL